MGKLIAVPRGRPSPSPWYGNPHSIDLDEYKHYIRSLAVRKDGQPVLNASVIVERLFATADDKIDILSGFFNAREYGREPVSSEAMLFLASSPDHKMRIILESGTSQDRAVNPFFAECAQVPNLELRKAPLDLQSRYAFHFIVADAASYRFEAGKNSPSAVATFGDTAGAKNLEGIFETLGKKSDVEAILPARHN